MIKREILSPGVRFLLITACIVVLVAGLKAAGELLRPFVLALFFAIISLPMLRWLQQKGVPSALAVILTVLADIAVLVAIVTLVGGSVTAFTDQAEKYQERIVGMTDSCERWLAARGLSIEEFSLSDLLNPGAIVDLVRTTLKSVADVVSKAFLVLLTMIFVMFEATGFNRKLRVAFELGDDQSARISRAVRQVQHYLAIKTLISLVTGLLIWLWLSFWDVDFAALWGLLAFLFNYIPSLGSILAAIPAVLLAAIQGGPALALIVAVAYLVVNLALGNFLEPNLMGRRMGLSTLVVFLSLIFWGWVWGPVGMLLSVPLTMIVKILLENTEEFRWVAVLLGKDAPEPDPSK